MSNSLKIKKHKSKEEIEKKRDSKEVKHGAEFLKNKREKGTITRNFTGKSSKEFSRKKT
ncbi:MAG: hypothetical protein KAH16_00220 [Candidatus Izimaplasma sp.]|nr:hypothetical protein [Candidatus Izimaplasma bacterium]